MRDPCDVRYVVLGAGAVGGTIGGRLADAGHEVVLLARGAHATAMGDHGLRLAMPDRVVEAKVPVASAAEALALTEADVLVVATKTQHTAELLDAVAALPVGRSTAGERLPLVCAQNGVENERLALRRFAAVYGMVVMMPAEHLEPGRIAAHGTPTSGLLDIGRYPRGCDAVAEQVAADLTASGFASRATTDVMAWKWAKLLRNVGNALEALCGRELSGADTELVMELDDRAREEAVACYQRAGITWVDDDTWRERRGHQVDYAPVEGQERTGGSSWQSVVRRAGNIEVDYLNGEIVLMGRLHDVATPVNALLQQQANALARAGGAPGDVPVRQLFEALQGSTNG